MNNNFNHLAPIVIFVYNRPWHTQQTIEALQKNELARPVFENVFEPIDNLSEGALTIENTLSTDHETFDHYNIPSFQFIQDELAYGNVTHHTQLDVLEYVPEEDIMKNAVILAWTIYKLSENDAMVPRKVRD